MAIFNRSTLLQKVQDFINRVAPFTDALIQKSEDLEVRSDVLDSVIFKTPTVGSISSPAATFTADFATNDEININSAASISASFNVTLANLQGNSIGKLNITKKTNDVFDFANSQIIPYDTVGGQAGKTVLNLLVINTDTGYFVIPAYNVRIATESLSVTGASIISGSITRTASGACQLSGTVNPGVGETPPYTIATISNVLFRPLVNSSFSVTPVATGTDPNSGEILPGGTIETGTAQIRVLTTGVIEFVTGNLLSTYDLSSIVFINGN